MWEKRAPWIWVLAAFAVASTRAFENGLSLDPALLSAIARSFARDGVWWSLKASPQLFPHYYEHPFLPLWIQGLIFKLFGATDTTSRWLGLVAGAGSFYYLYRIGELLQDRRYATLLCFVTLLSAHFVGRMPTMYYEISLTFFFLGSLYYLLRAFDERPWTFSLWSGVFLGLAFWTKGLAAIPMGATLVGVALWRLRAAALRSPTFWIPGLVGLAFGTGFCGLQGIFGTYPFCSRYLEVSLFKKVMGPGAVSSAPAFLRVFFVTHPLHTLLAGAGLVEALRGRAPRWAAAVGAIGSFFLLAAGATLGKTYYHYYYSIYPMVNLLTAAFLYGLADRKCWEVRWEKGALGFAAVYVLLWNLIPVHMRHTVQSDYVQLAGVVKSLKAKGLDHLEVVGLPDIDWIYREMSYWYWDVDSWMARDPRTTEGDGVLIPAGIEGAKTLEGRGYQSCATTAKFDLYVRRVEWIETCRRSPLDPALIR